MKIYLILFLTLLVSCVGPEYMGPPESSEEAEINGVLIHRYTPSKKRVKINDNYYIIEDAWTSYDLPERYSKNVNKKAYEFFIVIKDDKTGKLSTDYSFTLPRENIIYNGIKYGYSIGVGDSSGMLAVDFISEKKQVADDTLSFTLINSNDEKTLLFYKEKSASR